MYNFDPSWFFAKKGRWFKDNEIVICGAVNMSVGCYPSINKESNAGGKSKWVN